MAAPLPARGGSSWSGSSEGGVGGGAGDTTTKGNVEDTVEQSESDDTGPVKC